ncbi:glycoside hydrolase family 15 protein [Streptomyces lunaelactis]|uniref:glycoside hydrolase family 15 protein n=1 Tax=Streptomyces lunaelactis TaxID=1535768 RepID=UPI001585A049|nr:glycoside hydrolase family 15 protein [Streptomyces lunaelactis]NUK02235.1 glycoside hydrolase family 15 protein [Streptomyces lunaelactis]NUK08579.1 glycoside hydrolase family 15 protein [Streptomyces lunaelactis]NUK32593.1 glycoside hydrolase family 15 protein [Streptomyces lunaelactis]NUK41622.1 glycoside hydrolase family 15 protein [Streptomyces lunaelactis]NUK48970.1 glycoside hydrolase family 15 protein [Streptomyces lunaelactis]
MDRYPPIADHGLIGDLQTAALVSSQGVIDWFAAPRFDSPSVFAALLDHDRGGYFLFAPDDANSVCKQLYYPDTAVLVTRFMSPEGVGEVLDYMPPGRILTPTDRHTLVRVVRSVRGTVRFSLKCAPRFDYGRATHELELRPEAAAFRAPAQTGYLQATFPLEREGLDVRGEVTLNEGESAAAAFTVCDPDGELPAPITVEALNDQLFEVGDFWQNWLRTSRYNGRWSDMVNRSAITLKLLTYAPTGAPVAAATMGLPEQVGGERNWDYRYTWIRDGSLSVRALLDLGFVDEAARFTHWLGDRMRDRADLPGERLQIMYRVDGDPDIPEEILDHFEGYRGSSPVRAGNAAMDQLQLDIYGEALYALAEGREVGSQTGYHGWKGLAKTLDWLADSWDRPDEGIWETRGGRKDFTYSRVMCWVAFDRGLTLAREFSRPADSARWTAARDAILDQVMERAWSDKEQALVQHYDGDVMDASLLLIPRVGFLGRKSPGWLSTLDAMDRKLVSDSLVYRYDPTASPDGLRGSEGTFSLCTFLYVDALAMAGRLSQARYAFEKMHTYANHVGLFAEEIGPSGEQLGNFPQAFTHLSLIMAATTLDGAIDREQGR